jgi:outer membrane receptor protein involved in Fe transport
MQTNILVQGPFQIPYLFRKGQFNLSYNRTQNHNGSLQTAQMPTAAERLGDFSQSAVPVIDPETGQPFSGNIVPTDRLSPQAQALLSLYPDPNFIGGSRYNYQVPLTGVTHGDNIQAGLNNIALNNNERLSGTFGYSNTRSDSPDLFGFTDVSNTTSTNGSIQWNHRFTQRVSATIRYQFSRSVTESLPYFGGKLDISGMAGITGNDTDPRNWGPPGLNFSGGIARLSSGSFAYDRNQSHLVSYASAWAHLRHALTYSIDYRRQQFNLLSQRDARGNFTFTGATTGNDFADFLLGVPATSSIAFGNADKYFRQSYINAFVRDNWQVRPQITLDLGVRWEYESPITERYGRLVNLDIAPGFTSATPVVAGSGKEALVHTDKSGVEPRIGLAWRPMAASSLIVRAGYGIYRDTSVYRTIADQMAQQSPLSKSLSVQNTPLNPFTLANGFQGVPGVTATTFAIDPNFRVGTAQNWSLSIQQDLPQSMQMTVTYLGIKGSHIPQRILPNTFPVGSVNPCPDCPIGFTYLTSGGNSTRNAGTIEVRRRQRNGFQASVQYTYAKAIDNAGLGGNSIAQNWLDLRSERALSNFDQRHQVAIQAQYTSGMLASIGSFWDGWRGKLLKEWTITANMTAGSGQPLTPILLVPTPGTGVPGSLRPDVTGAPIALVEGGGYLNAAAFAAPAPGQWGNAGRNSITGPAQFGLNASLARTFRFSERVTMDVRVDSSNVLNHVSFPRWNSTVNSSQFGLPTGANSMRSLQPSVRVRF